MVMLSASLDRPRRSHRAAIVILAALSASAASAADCTRRVAPGGSDGAGGTPSAPWATLQHAVDTAAAGDVVCVDSGTYSEGEVRITRSGTEVAPITVTADGQAVTVLGAITFEQGAAHWRLDGLTVSGYDVWGVSLIGDNRDIELTNLEISGGEAAIRLTVGDSGDEPWYGPVSEVLIEDCRVHDVVYSTIDCTPGPCDDLVVRRVEASGAGVEAGFAGDGIAVERGERIVVEDCRVHDNGGDGIDLGSRDVQTGSEGIVVRRNVVARQDRNGIKVWSGGRVENNLVHDCGDTLLVLEAGVFEVVNNTFASLDGYNYLAVLGSYDRLGPAQVTAYNNVFFNDDPQMGGVLVFVPQDVTLDADHNLYHNPYAEELLCTENVAGGPCWSGAAIEGGAWFAASGQGQHSRAADPAFLAAGADDFHLTPGSPAVDAGDPQRAPATDLDGLPRDAAPDMGAYEYRAGGGCTIACAATVPATASIGVPIAFSATATTSGCSGQPSFAWSFGDGASAAGRDVSHTYAAAGSYAWSSTVTVDGVTCTRQGSIRVEEFAADHRYLIPVAAHWPGLGGTQWRTDVGVLNLGAAPATVSLTLVTDSGSIQRTRTVAAGGGAEWADVVVDVFGVNPAVGDGGALHVAADRPLLLASRTYNQTAGGTYGQFLPALGADDMLTDAAAGYLVQLKHGADFRTNLGFANPGSSVVGVRYTVRSASGTTLLTRTVSVPAGGWVQDSDVLSGVGGSHAGATAEVRVLTSGGRVWAYASVVDRRTGDGTTVPIQVP